MMAIDLMRLPKKWGYRNVCGISDRIFARAVWEEGFGEANKW